MKNNKQTNKGIIAISVICLLLTIIPSFLVFWGVITSDLNKILMLCGTIGWFITAPYWMNKKQDEESSV
jgi:hypothetical protein